MTSDHGGHHSAPASSESGMAVPLGVKGERLDERLARLKKPGNAAIGTMRSSQIASITELLGIEEKKEAPKPTEEEKKAEEAKKAAEVKEKEEKLKEDKKESEKKK